MNSNNVDREAHTWHIILFLAGGVPEKGQNQTFPQRKEMTSISFDDPVSSLGPALKQIPGTNQKV